MIRKRDRNQQIEAEPDKPKFIQPTEPIQITDSKQYFKSYKDEAIWAINLLEQQGINIYDPNRHGGMYLKKKTDSKNIGSIFSEKSQPQTTTSENNQKTVTNDFKSFFSK